ncbi:MAG: ABC transporter substrate-binding protein [Gammaproteobacteria bacterium]|nr:ABC transporter substrate-binding protein [Gammaproteobacteria bacterium]
MKKLSLALAISTLATGMVATAHAEGKHAQGGVLTVPIITQTFVEDFNPYSGAQGDMVGGTMFEPLWAVNALKGEINWRLASRFTYDADLMGLTINLKDGLTWSDGEVLDAEDVVFSLNLGKDDAKLDATGQWGSGKFASAEATDSLTVYIKFTDRDGTIDWHLPRLHVVPEHIWKDVEDISTYKNGNPVGSGPITEVTQVKDNQIQICRNPNYYKADEGLPYLDCIKFRQYTDNSQIQAALINDEIDWGSNFIADIEKTYVAPNPENHGFWYPANDLINVYLNTREAPFSDINFRKAFSMALDRPMIVDLAAYGYPTPETHVTGIGEFFKSHFNDQVNAKYDYLAEYNPNKAMDLLDESGYVDVDGDGFLENPDGTEINFDIHVVNGWTDWVQTVQMVSEYLAEIGIRANTKTVDWSVYDTALKKGTYQASINWSKTNAEDPIQAYQDYFHTSRQGMSWHTNHGVSSPEVDALIDEYLATSNAERRKAILAELMAFTAESLAFVPLFSNPTWYQYNATRIGGWPTAENAFVQPVFYESSRKLITFEQLYAK